MSDSKNKKRNEIKSVTEDQQVSSGRRKFTKAAILASPVLMAVNSKPVWANLPRQCSPSVLQSANHSIPTDWNDCKTCSPGYWHGFNSGNSAKACWISAGMQGHENDKFGDLFGILNISNFPAEEEYVLNLPLIFILNRSNANSTPSQLNANTTKTFFKFGRAATVSFLNPRALGHLYPTVAIPTEASVRALVQDVFTASTQADRLLKAGTGKDALHIYWDEGTVSCILPNNKPAADCPSSTYNIKP